MAGEVKLEILFGRSIYVLTRANCERVLALLDADAELGELLSVLREDLRKAVSGKADTPALENPFPDETEEPPAPWLSSQDTLKNVAKENADACGDCRIPKCRFCDQPGTRAGGRKDATGRIVEWYYVCKTPDCLAARMATPQPLALFV